MVFWCVCYYYFFPTPAEVSIMVDTEERLKQREKELATLHKTEAAGGGGGGEGGERGSLRW